MTDYNPKQVNPESGELDEVQREWNPSFQKSFKHDPNRPDLTYQRAFQMETSGDHSSAGILYRAIIDAPVQVPWIGQAWFRLGCTTLASKEYLSAITTLKKAAQLFENKPDQQDLYDNSCYLIAFCQEMSGHLLTALSWYERMENSEKLIFDVCYRKMLCFDRLGRFEDVLQSARRFEQQMGEHPDAESGQALFSAVTSLKNQIENLLDEK